MKSSVIIFPGSNCDRDMDVALKKFGFKNKMVWHNDNVIPKSDLVVLPGGFSYGDYLRCGSIAAKSNIINSVIEFANKGGLVIGICNGFQILIETGLVTGALLRNKYLEFICKNVFVKINNKDLNNYFSTDGLKSKINLPFIITETLGKYDLSVNVSGGGNTGQADAIKLAVSRALCEVNEEYRPLLKKEGLLTRDSRVVERKKPGQKKARKKFQWVKR